MVNLVFHKDLTLEKWAAKPLSWQILSIASELGRAQASLEKDLKEPFRSSLERGFELIDLTVEANLSREGFLREMLRFREVLAGIYSDPDPRSRLNELKFLLKLLPALEPDAYNLLSGTA